MEINIRRWDVHKDWIANEEYGRPFDWLNDSERLHIIALYKQRLKDGLI